MTDKFDFEVTPVRKTAQKAKESQTGSSVKRRNIPEISVDDTGFSVSRNTANRESSVQRRATGSTTEVRRVQSAESTTKARRPQSAETATEVRRPQRTESTTEVRLPQRAESTTEIRRTRNDAQTGENRRYSGEVRQRKRIPQDMTGNRYARNREEEKREENADKRERERFERRKEIEEASSIFTQGTRQRNYFINLAIVTFKMLLVCILVIGFSGIGFVLGMSKSYLEAVPELDFSLVTGQDQSTVLLDVNGEILGNYYNMENREWATLDEIPETLQNAVIAIEDVRFRRHMGIDFKRIFGVALSNLASGSMQGGSTITQQLIKNTMLSFEQTYKRKIQEASLALELEKKYEKDQILEAYLNTIYMGGSCYGVKTAAKDYFGKELSELSARECACLAGMIQNPSRYNPRSNYYSRSNPARTDNRTNLVLYEMKENGLISLDDYDVARNDSLTVLESSPYSTQAGMIYFTDYVIDSVVDAIISDRGLEDDAKTRSELRKEIRTEGYSIYTTLDAAKQQAAEEAVYNFGGYPSMRYSDDSYTVIGRNPDGSVIRLIQPQAAVAVTDYRNGYIVALVGGRQAPTGSLEFNRAYQSTMPVGSSIKPLAVYGPAIEKGAGIGTVYYDYQMKINGWDSVNGYPANNSRKYNNAPVTMRKAFVNSLNVTAAQALMYDVGLDDAYNTLVNLGVKPEHISKTGSGLALGSSGIPPLEMAGAFSTIANMGVYTQPIAFTKVTDKNGNVILDMLSKQQKRRVFSESTAWQVTSMMRSVAQGNSRTDVPGQTVYGKTGTNSENRGVFFAGFTGYYVGCVWIGSDAYKQLPSNAQGGVYAAPLFAAVMKAIHKGLPNKAANDIDPASIGVQTVTYCTISGKKATKACTQTHTEYGDPSKIPDCDLHRTVEVCSESNALATQFCPEESKKTITLVTIPQTGALNYMYYNEHDRFISLVGSEPTVNMSSCSVHTVQTQPTQENTQKTE